MHPDSVEILYLVDFYIQSFIHSQVTYFVRLVNSHVWLVHYLNELEATQPQSQYCLHSSTPSPQLCCALPGALLIAIPHKLDTKFVQPHAL